MNTDTKFKTIVAPEADQALDTLTAEALEPTLAFLAIALPNITRRDAITKVNTPLGTIFVFQVPEAPVVVTCLNGHNQDGERVMIVVGVGQVTV
jgi:hypothetical protein